MDTEREKVLLQEVGPRDGLQNEPRSISPESRAELINELVRTGIARIQIGSFVNPRRVPQMLGTHLVWQLVDVRPGTRYTVLVLNEKGLEQAINAGIPHVEVYVSASRTHSMRNSGNTRDNALDNASRMIEIARSAGVGVTAGVMCAFGCSYEGPLGVESVLGIVESLEKSSPTELCLADTTGMAHARLIEEMIASAGALTGVDRLAIHLHDAQGVGYDNLKAALDNGVRRFDTSVGGIGGCPFIPDAVGNISTERTVEIAESMGFSTGVDLPGLMKVKSRLESLLGKDLTPPRLRAN